MLNIIRGNNDKIVLSEMLEEILTQLKIEGNFYIGYPIIPTMDSSIFIEASLVTANHGLILFDLSEEKVLSDRIDIQDNIYNSVEAKLKLNNKLVKRRKLLPDINVITFCPGFIKLEEGIEDDDFLYFKNKDELSNILKKLENKSNESIFKELLSAVQAVSTIKTYSARENIKDDNSRGAKIKSIEHHIANLDIHQNQAVIETVEGPQRIRGLAGSGKTIVLALKAAYLHSKNREWNIAITFNTRSLKGQIIDLIERFTYEFIKDKPNWNKIHVIHAWGSPSFDGIYYQACKANNVEYLDYSKAKYIKEKSSDEYSSEFDLACCKAISDIQEFKELYDAILIDEAQDFSDSFLNICYNSLKNPKRLIWAYDELQTLNKTSMKSPENIFGYENGRPKVELNNLDNKPKQDIILKKCYRNSRPILTTAHALGFGIYRSEGLVQMFDDQDLWEQIGYEVLSGKAEAGYDIELSRSDKSSPLFLENHSDISDIISRRVFKNKYDQAEWIAEQIYKNIKEDELEFKDILVIHTNPLKTRSETGYLRQLLYDKGINSHLAGVSNSPDEFFIEDSITFTGIYRAKGNEAPMVYIMNCEECYAGIELIKKRNILFTALTRSKAWVRMCGVGTDMEELDKEIQKVIDSDFKLIFKYPTAEQMDSMNIIHRDRTIAEKKKIENKNNALKSIVDSISMGEISINDLDTDLLKEIFERIKKD